jgi:hypothetical protein
MSDDWAKPDENPAEVADDAANDATQSGAEAASYPPPSPDTLAIGVPPPTTFPSGEVVQNRSSRNRVGYYLAAVGFLGIIGLVAFLLQAGSSTDTALDLPVPPAPTQSATPTESTSTSDPESDSTIPGVEVFENQSRNHTDQPLPLTSLPPAGGDHFTQLQNCRAYNKPVDNGNAVHSLEHGSVWITYNPSLPQNQIDDLNDLAKDQSHVLVSPYPGLPSPVVMTAWGRQLELADPQDQRVVEFLQEYLGGEQSPEPDAPCSGGAGSVI